LVPTPITTPVKHAHVWVVNAQIEVDAKTAKLAEVRHSFKAAEGQKIDVLDTMCKWCRRAFEDVHGQACEAKIDNSHLIGGREDKSRAKRKKPVIPEGAVLMPGPRIDRRGVDRAGY